MPKNHIQINPNYCSKLQAAFKKKYNKLEIPGPWSSYNCYLLYDKPFESQIEAQKFCQDAFGYAYVGELAYGIGIGSSPAVLRLTNAIYPSWKYLRFGILHDIENFICQCSTTGNKYIGLKNGTSCPIPKNYNCPATSYDITTICVLSELAKWYSYELDVSKIELD